MLRRAFAPLPLIAISEQDSRVTGNITSVIVRQKFDRLIDNNNGVSLLSRGTGEIYNIYSLLPISKNIIIGYLRTMIGLVDSLDVDDILTGRVVEASKIDWELSEFMDKYDGVDRRYVSVLRKLTSKQIQSDIWIQDFPPEDRASALTQITFVNRRYVDEMGFDMLKMEDYIYRHFDTPTLIATAVAMQVEVNNMGPLINLLKESEGRTMLPPPVEVMYLHEFRLLLPAGFTAKAEYNNRITVFNDKDFMRYSQNPLFSAEDLAVLGIERSAPVLIVG